MNGLKVVTLAFLFTFGTTAFAQSGRRAKTAPAPTPTPDAKPAPTPSASLPARVPVTAEKDQDYRCTEDGSLAHLLDNGEVAGFTAKEVDTKAEVTAKPDPTYTREARRMGVEGVVVLKVLLMPDGTIDRVRVVRRLPFGLTENAIFAACQIKFRPAVKADKPVPQWVTVQYGFRLANSSIFGP